ncbi:MAG: DUF3187 family protein [Candidatus Omnitrophota bacterium]|nr:DUF3187 family protein [Candidatus Omnitrophota bacterium]
MKRYNIQGALILVLLLFFVANALAKTGPEPLASLGYRAGPITIRNQMPLYLFYLQMEPDKADTIEQNKFYINADYTVSNITVSSFTPASSLYNINIDAEVSRMTLDLRYGIYENTEIGLEIPYLSLSAGYLDGFVEEFEKTVGATTPRSRIRQGSYNFNYSFIYNNENLIKRTNASDGLGDVVLKAKHQLLEEDRYGFLPNMSFRASAKFPTGEKSSLLGSGEFDYGFGVLLDKTFSEKITVYAGCNFIVIEKPDFFSVLNLKRNMISGMMGIEYLLTQRFSLVTQIMGNSTPYPSSGTNVLDESAIDVGLGFNYIWKEKQNVSWHFAFTENINSAASPDVSLNTGWNVGF